MSCLLTYIYLLFTIYQAQCGAWRWSLTMPDPCVPKEYVSSLTGAAKENNLTKVKSLLAHTKFQLSG